MTDKTITILDDDQGPLADPILETEEVSSEGESPVETIADTEELETDEATAQVAQLQATHAHGQGWICTHHLHRNGKI